MANIIFHTSNSIYEVDKLNSRIRRVYGKYEVTKYQKTHGEWREYKSISLIRQGSHVEIVWKLENNVLKTTQTTNVIKVTTDNLN